MSLSACNDRVINTRVVRDCTVVFLSINSVGKDLSVLVLKVLSKLMIS